MKALHYNEFGGAVTVAELPDPTAPDGGVVLRVGASGLCRSDWHAWAGHDDTVALPHVPGHEFAGEIVAVGAGVDGWRTGQRVTAPFVNGCGRCAWCRSGQAQVCPQQTQPGFTHWGSHAELVAVRAADLNLVALPEDLSWAAAASLGCRFATAFRALAARAAVRPGEWLVVHGAGGVGLSTIMIGRALGARVIAVDLTVDALALAGSVGAEQVVLAGDDAPAEIAELTSGGAHVAVDAVGSPATCTASLLSLRRRGRHVQIGLLPAGAGPDLPLGRVIGWELDLLGSHGMAAADYPAMLAMVAEGTLRPQDLLGATVDLHRAAELLPLPGSAPSTGVTVIDPYR